MVVPKYRSLNDMCIIILHIDYAIYLQKEICEHFCFSHTCAEMLGECSAHIMICGCFLFYSIMSDKSELKAELERKKQRLAQIREEKKRKEEERKKKEVRTYSQHIVYTLSVLAYIKSKSFLIVSLLLLMWTFTFN